MAGPLLSSSWYRVVDLKPRLRPHTRMHRHRYRGRVWFVVADALSGRTHRFTPAARLLINGMDGSRTVGELWEIGHRRLGDDAPSQDELIGLLGQLHAADLLQSDVSPDVSELLTRSEEHERAKVRQKRGNPMSIKVRLFDPDALLDRLHPYVCAVWNKWGALIWILTVIPASILAMIHWSDLTQNVSDRVLATSNLIMLGVLFPLIKVAHEMGHALATKMRGGRVHEMGIMLLMLMPVPYVDASAATTFRSKRDRVLVGAAGMLVELFLAALAMYVWVLVEPGMVRSIAFNTLLVAGVSTVVFNGNPLLRYDGYYILADWIEIPNLAVRSNRYLGYLIERYAFKSEGVEAPMASVAEKAWFVIYAPTSFVYRTMVSLAIVVFIAGEFFLIGIGLALWTLVTSLFLPIWKLVIHLFGSPSLARVRGRALILSGTVLSGVLAFLFLIPMPFRTQSEGVVWMPEQAMVRAGGDGFVRRWLAAPGSLVRVGDPLMQSEEPELEAQLKIGQAKVAELQAKFNELFVVDKVAAELARDDLQREQASLARLQERIGNLAVKSPGNGHFMVHQAGDVIDRYFRKGDLLGYLSEETKPKVRVLIHQEDIDLIRQAYDEVEVRGAPRLDKVIVGQIIREVPGGALQLPSRALSVDGGGQVAVDPRDTDGLTALNRHFQIEIELPTKDLAFYGARVHVRFEHRAEPLAYQWYRRLRPLLLSQFHV